MLSSSPLPSITRTAASSKSDAWKAIVAWADRRDIPPENRPLVERLRFFANAPYTYERIISIEDAGRVRAEIERKRKMGENLMRVWRAVEDVGSQPDGASLGIAALLAYYTPNDTARRIADIIKPFVPR